MTLTIKEIFEILEKETRKYNKMIDEESSQYNKIKLNERIETLRELYDNFLRKEANNQNELWLLRYGK